MRRLLAVQAQDLRAARLALRARGVATAAEIDAALTDTRELVVAWLNRGTLHLVHRDDYAWLLALTAPPRFTSNARRLRQEGVSPDDAERAVAAVERALADEGPLTRPELAERMAAHGIRTAGQATPHLLMLAALRGVAVLTGEAYALTRDWLGEEPAVPDRDEALAELGRRYLAGHAPAGPGDLAQWAGIGKRDATAALQAAGTAGPAETDPVGPRLLGAFDPYLLGWRDRSFAVAPEHAKAVHPGGGIIRAAATVDGRVVGTWAAPNGQVSLELFEGTPERFAGEVGAIAAFQRKNRA